MFYFMVLLKIHYGKKMSKSKGNVIDPLELIEQYGADAVRFALIYGNAMGNDQSFRIPSWMLQKKFSNKIWNMGRFILDFKPEEYNKEISEKDKDIIKKTEKLIFEVTELIKAYRLNEALQLLYEFSWHEFADKYIEEAKTRREESQVALELVYTDILKLLHPFMPFITEEIFGKLSGNNRLLITEEWPSFVKATEGQA